MAFAINTLLALILVILLDPVMSAMTGSSTEQYILSVAVFVLACRFLDLINKDK